MDPTRVLYVSYDGLLEPLGQSQVLPQVRGLAASGVEVTLLTFEKPSSHPGGAAERLRAELFRSGIRWRPLRYHKRPSALATAWDVLRGLAYGIYARFRFRCAIVHARSYVAALIGLILKHVVGTRLVFDMRGFWADERVEGGIWPRQSGLYRLAKWFEKRFFLAADEVVTLTRASVPLIRGLPYLQERAVPITVIPTCADLERFRIREPSARIRGRLDPDHRLTLMFAGTFGSWYMPEEMLACFRVARMRVKDARLVVLANAGGAEFRRRAEVVGLNAEDIFVDSVPYSEMPEWISVADVGLFFIRPVWSKKASNPTKLGEFLGCGVPVVINAGIGDTAEIVREGRVGVVVEAFTDEEYDRALGELEPLLAEEGLGLRCRAVAASHFSLTDAVERYAAVYRRLRARDRVPSGG